MPLFQNTSVLFFEGKLRRRSNGILVGGRFFDQGRGMLQSANKGTAGKLGFARNNWMKYHGLRAKSVSGTSKASSRGYCRCPQRPRGKSRRTACENCMDNSDNPDNLGAHLPFAPNQACNKRLHGCQGERSYAGARLEVFQGQ